MPRQSDESVFCKIPGCGRIWPRDPVLEVQCPTCDATAGSPCVVRRPSGHVHTAAFGGLPEWGHDTRDLAADAAGVYGPCPLGRCGAKPQLQLGLGLSDAVAAL